MRRCDLLIRNGRPMGGALTDIALVDGQIAGMGEGWSGPEFDGGGGTILPGLIDHHIHLFATAARRESIDLTGIADPCAALDAAARARPPGSWLRAFGLDGRLGRAQLDACVPDHPLRVQDRTGALWMLNSAAMAALGPRPYPDFVDEARGAIWRGDTWLRERITGTPPSLIALGEELARYGITGVTDAGANNGPQEAQLLASAGLPQRLMLMGREDLPALPGVMRGPLKLLYDEAALPDPEEMAQRISVARKLGRPVAAHCVTLAELLAYLAALDLAGGAQAGDRVEHGSVIPATLIPDLAARGLCVVSQPGFVAARGDAYLDRIAPDEQSDLYRLASLKAGGVRLAAGSDAPYGPLDPWQGMATAMQRMTDAGKPLGLAERLSAPAALALYLGSFDNPGCPARAIAPGVAGDFCLIEGPIAEALAEPDAARVQATFAGGKPIFTRH